MRDALRHLVVNACEHAGLAYEVIADVGPDGKIPEDEGKKTGWLSDIAQIKASADYVRFFDVWKASFSQPGDVTVEVAAVSRLLVGHGLGSATDVGLALHRTWGVPVVPGSALKGLLAHYVDAVFGPDPKEPEPERVPFGGVVWEGRRILHGPGEVHRALFGAPEADAEVVGRPKEASRGLVTFHDALWVPNTPGANPLAVDVLTVHQKRYYDSAGDSPPVDWDGPTPVAFLSVRPGARFLIALSGPPEWTALAKELLLEALREWGVGGKTAAGYGRLEAENRSARSSSGPAEGEILDCVLVDRRRSGQWRARHEPSGLQGPIVNSNRVPAALEAGSAIRLKLILAKGNDSRFVVP